MEDVKEIFEVNVGKRVIIHVLGDRHFIEGEIEEVFQNYVALVEDKGSKFCVLYQGIVSVELRTKTKESRKTFSR